MTKPRVLISYWFGNKTIPLGAAIADGFTELGFEVFCFNTWIESWVYSWLLKPASRLLRALGFKNVDLSINSRWGRELFRQQQFRKMALRVNPDILLIIHGHPIHKETLAELKIHNPRLLTLGWWVENPRDDNRPLLAQIKLYDHYFCIHRYNYPKDLGVTHMHAIGVDAKRYHVIDPPLERDIQVVFVGSWYPKREEYLSTIADLPLSIYGPIWEKKCKNPMLLGKVKRRSIWGKDLLELYNRSQIVINISIWDSLRETLNLRVVDVPATGALLITDDSSVLREFLEPGKEVVTFSSPEELRQQVIYYLKNSEERIAIATAGWKKIQQIGSYTEKVTEMLQLANYLEYIDGSQYQQPGAKGIAAS